LRSACTENETENEAKCGDVVAYLPLSLAPHGAGPVAPPGFLSAAMGPLPRPLPVHLARTHGDCAADFGGRHFVGVADAGTAAFVRYNSWQSDEVQRLL